MWVRDRNRKCPGLCLCRWASATSLLCSHYLATPALFICGSCDFRLQCELLHSYLCVKAPLAGLAFQACELISWQSHRPWRVFIGVLSTCCEGATLRDGLFETNLKTFVNSGIGSVWTSSGRRWKAAFCPPSICICKSKHCRSLDFHPADPPAVSLAFLLHSSLFTCSIHSLSPQQSVYSQRTPNSLC